MREEGISCCGRMMATGVTRAIQERQDIQIVIYDEASAQVDFDCIIVGHIRQAQEVTARCERRWSTSHRPTAGRTMRLGEKLGVSKIDEWARGLDLARATVICWYAPIDKAETYQQANARSPPSSSSLLCSSHRG